MGESRTRVAGPIHGVHAALACALAMSLSCGPPTEAAERSVALEAPRPDVIVVAIDGLAWDQIGAFGSALGETPAFDRLLEDGVAYTGAYATSPWAGEALTSVLSGCLPPLESWERRAGAEPGQGATPGDAPRAGSHVPGLAEYLRHLGYRTAFAPSHPLHEPTIWAQAGSGSGRGTAREGRADDSPVDGEPPLGFDVRLPIEGQGTLAGAQAHDVAAAAVEWLGKEPGPSLLVCTLCDPRPPHHLFPGVVPAADVPYEGPVRSGLSHSELLRRAPDFGPDDRARLIELHATEVAVAELAFDHIAGAAMARRKTPPIVILVGLRRPALGEGGRYGLLPSLAPTDLEVPVIIRFPQGLDGAPGPSGETDIAVSLADLTPTILDALGLEPRLDIEGRSVFPGARQPSRPIIARTGRARGGLTLIDGSQAVSVKNPEARSPGQAPGPETFEYHRKDPQMGWVGEDGSQGDWRDLTSRLRAVIGANGDGASQEGPATGR